MDELDGLERDRTGDRVQLGAGPLDRIAARERPHAYGFQVALGPAEQLDLAVLRLDRSLLEVLDEPLPEVVRAGESPLEHEIRRLADGRELMDEAVLASLVIVLGRQFEREPGALAERAQGLL